MKNETEISGITFFSSWSGGKDSCLSLFRMIKAGNHCASLITILDETGLNSRSHGLTPETLKIQAEAMDFPLKTANTAWGEYENNFKALIVVVNRTMMPERFLGLVIDSDLIEELEAEGVDACGENGEFHTFVFDGPLFKREIKYIVDKTTNSDNYTFLPITASFA